MYKSIVWNELLVLEKDVVRHNLIRKGHLDIYLKITQGHGVYSSIF